jgi:hypothetical protein
LSLLLMLLCFFFVFLVVKWVFCDYVMTWQKKEPEALLLCFCGKSEYVISDITENHVHNDSKKNWFKWKCNSHTKTCDSPVWRFHSYDTRHIHEENGWFCRSDKSMNPREVEPGKLDWIFHLKVFTGNKCRAGKLW